MPVLGRQPPESIQLNVLKHGGCGGFFLACEDFVGRFNDSFPADALNKQKN